ncbi:glycine oxidase ThiO [Microbacterium sp. ASV81]|uniref:glycine oxidase n=1 Tax=Microbacterium capsulatum TaxID=3041921 RepID=A0ABU0XHS2_9MICO|nr:glycine oxidase ThiO [Microbacterium sp. ASV81]MDQ4214676.1 glycine oxidase ThiO [Microbacterium sp. ASV81]
MRIAVAGAGIIGLATAVELDRRGHEVVVFDPAPASGASLAAAGMLAAVTEIAWAQDALHPLMADSAARYPDFVARLEADAGRAVGHRVTETLSVAVDAADRETLAQLAALQGPSAGRVTGSRARELEPALAPAVSAAVLVADDHQIDPRQVTAALLELLGERVRRERVAEVLRDAGRVSGVRLASGERVAADVVVAAAGLATSGIAGVPVLPLRPVWGDILRLRVPAALRPLLTRTIRALVHGRAVYLVPREDGTVVLGATVREGGVAGVQAGGVLALLRDAERILPGIDECEIVEMLARPRPGSPDAAPLLGVVEPGLVVSTGYDRHGVLLTPLAAEVGADLVEGIPVDPARAAAVDPFRFGPLPAFASAPDAASPTVPARDVAAPAPSALTADPPALTADPVPPALTADPPAVEAAPLLLTLQEGR